MRVIRRFFLHSFADKMLLVKATIVIVLVRLGIILLSYQTLTRKETRNRRTWTSSSSKRTQRSRSPRLSTIANTISEIKGAACAGPPPSSPPSGMCSSASTLLEEVGLAGKKIAVELNREIITRSSYDATVIKSGDNIEIVQFVGGG